MELSRRWQLGADLREAIAGHHDDLPVDASAKTSLPALVNAANRIAHAVDLGDADDTALDEDISAALQAPWFRTVAEVSAFATSPTSDIGCIPNASNPYFINCAGLYFAYLNANEVPFTASSVRAPAATGLIKTLNTRARPLDGTGCTTSPNPLGPFGEGANARDADGKMKPPGYTKNK